MEARRHDIIRCYSCSLQVLKETVLLLPLSLYGVYGLLGEQPVLLHVLNTLRECMTGRLLLEDLEVVRQSGQLLHFVLDILF